MPSPAPSKYAEPEASSDNTSVNSDWNILIELSSDGPLYPLPRQHRLFNGSLEGLKCGIKFSNETSSALLFCGRVRSVGSCEVRDPVTTN